MKAIIYLNNDYSGEPIQVIRDVTAVKREEEQLNIYVEGQSSFYDYFDTNDVAKIELIP